MLWCKNMHTDSTYYGSTNQQDTNELCTCSVNVPGSEVMAETSVVFAHKACSRLW